MSTGNGQTAPVSGNGQSAPKAAKQAAPKAPERPKYGPTAGGGRMWGQGRPVEKSLNFLPSLKRLLGHLAPERMILSLVVLLAVVGVFMNVLGPKILGMATDVIFTGVIGKSLPSGASKEQVIAALRAQGNDKYAAMLERLNVIPGLGIDFRLLGELLLLALGLYLVASLFLWLQGYLLNGAVQRSIYRLRSQVEEKINRLPLSYFDKQSRGELLSRVTNDIDNISQSLQQTLSQLLTSVLTVIGVTVMMFIVSPVLALIALVTIPVSIAVVTLIGRRSQKLFIQQWKSTGELNGHIEEAFTGQSLVKVFGRQNEVEAVFAERNSTLYKASFGAQFVSGLIMPTMFFIGNLNYVAIAVVGGLRVASGTMNLGDVQAFIQYTRMFTQPLTQLASLANLLQSGVASAERVFEVLDEEEQVPEEATHPTCGRVAFEHIWFSYDAVTAKGDDPLEPPNETKKPLIPDLSLVAEPGSTVAIVGPTGAGKTTLVNLIMRFYELDRGRITLDGVDIATVPRWSPCDPTSAWCCRTLGSSHGTTGTTLPMAGRPPARRRSHAAAEADLR